MTKRAIEVPWILSVLGSVNPLHLLAARNYHRDILHAEVSEDKKVEVEAAVEIHIGRIRMRRLSTAHKKMTPHAYD